MVDSRVNHEKTLHPTPSLNFSFFVAPSSLQIAYTLADSPSLKSVLNDVFLDCYTDARNDTLRKYQLDSELFPEESPFSLVDILNADFIP